MGTCVLSTSAGHKMDEPNAKTCLACQLQCLSTPACHQMSFTLAQGGAITSTRQDLPSYRCDQEEWAITNKAALCVIMDPNSVILDSSMKTCVACHQHCTGLDKCGFSVWDGLQLPEEGCVV